jgi:hypothetical protein
MNGGIIYQWDGEASLAARPTLCFDLGTFVRYQERRKV